MGGRWSNWLGNHTASPRRIEAPEDVDGVVRAVAEAKARNERVRVLGGGYAWSPLIPVDGCLLSTKGLRAVRGFDRARHRITVEAGASLREVVDVAASYGLSLRSPAMFLGLTIGGLIATGSHGTGRHASTLGDSVVAFELVTADAEVLRVDEPGSELWRAVITNLGALGVLTAVTLQCEPMYNVRESHERVPAAEAASLIPTMLAEHEFVSLFWYPSSRESIFKVGDRTGRPAAPVAGRINPTFFERSAGWLGPIVPHLPVGAAWVSDLVGAAVTAGLGDGTRVVAEPYFSHYQQVYPPVVSSEFAVPVERAVEAWEWLHRRLTQYWRAGVMPVNMVAHARFGCASEALLASSAGRATCHIEVLSHRRNPQRELFLVEFDERMRGSFEGRAHWGKELVSPGRTAEGYGDRLERFLEVRRELDPGQRFLNPFLRDEVFGLGRRVVRARPSAPRAAAATPASELPD